MGDLPEPPIAGRHAHRVDRWARTWASEWSPGCPGSTALNSPRSLGSLALMGLGDKRWTHHIYLPLLSTISQETVASVLTWATYELAKNPRVARKVKEEVPSSPTVPMKNDLVVSQFRPLFYVEMLPYHRETENCWLLRLPAINCLHIP